MICKYFQVIFNVLKTFVWFQKKMEEPAGDETTEGLIQDCKGNSFFFVLSKRPCCVWSKDLN